MRNVPAAAASALLLLCCGLLGQDKTAQNKPRSVWDGVYSPAQAARGEHSYGPLCSHCHGDDLEGDIVENPQLAGPMFRDKWNGLNLGQLFERIHRDMPLDRAGSLSRAASVDLVAFILRTNDFPAGSADLPADAHALESIVIQSVRK